MAPVPHRCATARGLTKQFLNSNPACRLDPCRDGKLLTFADGRKVQYDALISTVPLDITLRWLGKPELADGAKSAWSVPACRGAARVVAQLSPGPESLSCGNAQQKQKRAPRAGLVCTTSGSSRVCAVSVAPPSAVPVPPPPSLPVAGLTHSSSHIVGIGIRGACPHGLKCWLYFPEDDCPFYRTTVFSHYAKANSPSDDTVLPTLCLADGSDPEAGSAGAKEVSEAVQSSAPAGCCVRPLHLHGGAHKA